MTLTDQQRAEYTELADYLQSENPAAAEAIRALLADLEEADRRVGSLAKALDMQSEVAEKLAGSVMQFEEEIEEAQADLAATRKKAAESKAEFAELMQKHNSLHLNAHETRKRLAEAQADNAAMHSAAHRLALEAECFYLDCKDMALVSKWDEPLQTAISDVQAIRWDGDNSAISAAIEAAVEPYRKDAERWRNLKPYYTAAVFDPEREDGLDLGKGVALVFMLQEGSRVSADPDATIDAIRARQNKEATEN